MKPWIKTFSGFLLLIFSFVLIGSLAFPLLSDPSGAGRVKRTLDVDFPCLKEEKSQYVFLYFGYVGCQGVCMPALNNIAQIYQKFYNSQNQPIPAFYFINMTPAMDQASVQSWVEYFNSHFKSYAPNPSELKEMLDSLNAVYIPFETKVEHAPYLYLLKRSENGYKLSFIYISFPYNDKVILEDLGVLE